MKRDEFLESPGRISQPELREVFGDEMPIAVAELLMKPRDGSIRELRAAIADLPGCVWEPATRPDTTGLELVAPDQHVGANAPARTNDTELTSLRAERDALKLKVESVRAEALEQAAKVAEQKALDFLSPEYATGQPLSSFNERFACGQIAEAIRSLLAPPLKVGE